jgi:hypothetical protein
MVEADLVRAGERVRHLVFCAREVIRRNGISTLRGLEAGAGSLLIHLSRSPPERRIMQTPKQVGDGPSSLPYRLDIWRRKSRVFSVKYDDLGRIEVAVFEPGAWEREVESLCGANAA